MSIFDIFTFRTKVKELFSKENIEFAFNKAANLIIEYKEFKEMPNEEKKARVDARFKDFIKARFKSDNKIVQFFVQQLINLVPSITQLIFKCLKKYVPELTKAN